MTQYPVSWSGVPQESIGRDAVQIPCDANPGVCLETSQSMDSGIAANQYF